MQTNTIEYVHSILNQAKHEIGDRSTTYDAPQGEESMPRIVTLFNRLYGTSLTVEQGWTFMVLLKIVRSTQGPFKQDTYVDMAAYAAFAAKAAKDERSQENKYEIKHTEQEQLYQLSTFLRFPEIETIDYD